LGGLLCVLAKATLPSANGTNKATAAPPATTRAGRALFFIANRVMVASDTSLEHSGVPKRTVERSKGRRAMPLPYWSPGRLVKKR
jgi:hypothetical protein